MRRVLLACSATLICLLVTPYSASAQLVDTLEGWQIGIRLITGVGASEDEIVRNIESGEQDRVAESTDLTGSQTVDLSTLIYGGSIRLLSPWSIGISVGFSSRPGSSIDLAEQHIDGSSLTTRYDMDGWRIPISAFYRRSLARLVVEVEAGIDVARTSIDFEQQEVGQPAVEDNTNGAGTGYHLGGSLSVGIGKSFEVFAQTEYLSLDTDEFKGSYNNAERLAITTQTTRGYRLHFLSPGTVLPLSLGAQRTLEQKVSGYTVTLGIAAHLPFSKFGAW